MHTVIWYIKWPIGIMVTVFTIGAEDEVSILGQVIPKTQKMVLDASLVNTQHYKVWVKGKWSNSRKGVLPTSHSSRTGASLMTFNVIARTPRFFCRGCYSMAKNAVNILSPPLTVRSMLRMFQQTEILTFKVYSISMIPQCSSLEGGVRGISNNSPFHTSVSPSLIEPLSKRAISVEHLLIFVVAW